MGQLERYGLYVLVVVIFLILGVALWGGDEPAAALDLPSANERQEPTGVTADVRKLFSTDQFNRFSAAPPAEPPNGASLDRPSSTPQGASGPNREVVPTPSVDTPVVTPQPAPPTDAARTHVIVSGETLSSISQASYGTPNRHREIAAANPQIDPLRLKPGTTIIIPAIAAVAASTRGSAAPVPAVAGQRSHTVVKGDVLGSIAKRYFGDAREWRRIVDANPGVDPKRLRPGQVLIIPTID